MNIRVACYVVSLMVIFAMLYVFNRHHTLEKREELKRIGFVDYTGGKMDVSHEK